MSAAPPAIGGFFELALPQPQAPAGLLAAWQIQSRRQTWRNATSAFAALLAGLPHQPERRVWLPAVICPALAAVVAGLPAAGRLAFYPQGEAGAPELAALQPALGEGDVVVVLSVLGAPTTDHVVDALRSAQSALGLWLLEDCAQALDTGQPAWADWRLYSPRKLLGVPDGGALVPTGPRASRSMPASDPGAAPDPAAMLAALAPACLRLEDATPTGLPQAFVAHQARESAQALGHQAMSRLSLTLLALADPVALAAQRRANHASLWAALPAWARQGPGEVAHAPFGLAVEVPAARRDAIRAALHAQRVFTAIYWPELPSPADVFASDHARAATRLVLPCDQRYGAADMQRVAHSFQQACREAA